MQQLFFRWELLVAAAFDPLLPVATWWAPLIIWVRHRRIVHWTRHYQDIHRHVHIADSFAKRQTLPARHSLVLRSQPSFREVNFYFGSSPPKLHFIADLLGCGRSRPNLGSGSTASSLPAGCYRPDPKIRSRPRHNTVHSLLPWYVLNSARGPPSRTTQKCVCRVRTEFARARSEPRSDGNCETGGEHNCGQTFCTEDLRSIPSLPPGSRSSTDRSKHRRSAGAPSRKLRGARSGGRPSAESRGSP